MSLTLPSQSHGLPSDEMMRVLSAAVINERFRILLLTDPEAALATGYNGEPFYLCLEEKELLLSIKARTLTEFAHQLTRWHPHHKAGLARNYHRSA